jgi:hypothetical protein
MVCFVVNAGFTPAQWNSLVVFLVFGPVYVKIARFVIVFSCFCSCSMGLRHRFGVLVVIILSME